MRIRPDFVALIEDEIPFRHYSELRRIAPISGHNAGAISGVRHERQESGVRLLDGSAAFLTVLRVPLFLKVSAYQQNLAGNQSHSQNCVHSMRCPQPARRLTARQIRERLAVYRGEEHVLCRLTHSFDRSRAGLVGQNRLVAGSTQHHVRTAANGAVSVHVAVVGEVVGEDEALKAPFVPQDFRRERVAGPRPLVADIIIRACLVSQNVRLCGGFFAAQSCFAMEILNAL